MQPRAFHNPARQGKRSWVRSGDLHGASPSAKVLAAAAYGVPGASAQTLREGHVLPLGSRESSGAPRAYATHHSV